ncbi:sugar ABC transporter substrate-binding protein [Spirochaetia bacterium]|nr:sugar ABC transporter substrate-binding protein [Spirochaetia bacterium]
MRALSRIVFVLVIATGMLVSCSKPAANKTAPVQKVIKLAHLYDPGVDANTKLSYSWIEGAAKQFEAENPDCKVELEFFPAYEQMDTKLMSDYLAGIEHGVQMTMSMQLTEHYKTGDLKDISAYVNAWDPAEKAEFSWNPVWNELSVGNKLYGIPIGMQARAIVYRKDMFAAAGLDPERPPKTIEELISYAQKLTKNDVWGLGVYLGPDRATNEITFCPYIWANGGDIWDPATKKASYASPEGVKTAKFLYDLVNTYKVTPEWAVSGSYTDVIQKPFINGQYAMVEGFGNYWIKQLQDAGFVSGAVPASADAKALSVGIFTVPEGSDRYTNGWCLTVAESCKNPDEAMKLLESLLVQDHLQNFMSAGLPGRKSVYQLGAYSSKFYQEWNAAASNGRPMPPTANYMTLADSISACLQEIVASKAPIESTLKRYQDEYNARYAGE